MSVNPILQYFVPKDRKFYPLFEGASANLVAISKVLVEALTTPSAEKRTSFIREIEKLEHVGDEFTHKIFQEVQQKQDWKTALDTLFVSLRGSFVFDNVAVYLKDPRTNGLEVAYARAVGRGKTAEADSA